MYCIGIGTYGMISYGMVWCMVYGVWCMVYGVVWYGMYVCMYVCNVILYCIGIGIGMEWNGMEWNGCMYTHIYIYYTI